MRLHRAFVGIICVAVAAFCAACLASYSHARDEAASEMDAVARDNLSVHAEMSETSPVVRTLRKGAAVSVEFELQRSGAAWCAVSEREDANVSGYVLCEGLERRQAKQWSRAGESGDENVSVHTTTDITLLGNHVLVPVTLSYKGRETSATLLLDTGASGTAVSTDVASALGLDLDKAVRVHAMAMGGNTVEIKVVQLDYMEVGPHRKDNPIVGVYEQAGAPMEFDGVLGMDFLGTVQYRLDIKSKVIRWE